ncbi:TrkA family potassium uptake protein [bacterium]|nr:TrkA family potassium uptake protein [bacterium]
MQFVIIGLGTFGSKIASTLYGEGQQVLVLDLNREKIESLQGLVTQAIHIDATDFEKLKEIGLESMDCAIINLGEPMETSVLTTMFLKELGIKEIIVKAISKEHGMLLKMLGATQILFPEVDMAIRLGKSLAYPNIVDQIPVCEGYSIVEMAAPESFWEKTLAQLDIRRVYAVEVIAIKHKEDGEEKLNMVPDADDVIDEGDNLLVVGDDNSLEKLNKLV